MKNLQSYTGLQAIDAKTAALSPLARKLRMKAGDRVAIVNSPPAYLAQLAPLPGDLHVEVKPDQSFDLVQLFVSNTDELRSLGANAIRGVKADGLLWVCYPKGGKTRAATDLPATPWWTTRPSCAITTPAWIWSLVSMASAPSLVRCSSNAEMFRE